MCDSDNNEGFIVDASFTRRAAVLTLSAAAAVGGAAHRCSRCRRDENRCHDPDA